MTIKANDRDFVQFAFSLSAVEQLVELLDVAVMLADLRAEGAEKTEGADSERCERLREAASDAARLRDFFAGHLAIGEPADGVLH